MFILCIRKIRRREGEGRWLARGPWFCSSSGLPSCRSLSLSKGLAIHTIQHFLWLMPWRRTFFVWVWSRYLAGATWARPFSPFWFPSIYMVCWITCEVDFTWPCLLQLHPRLVSCSKTNKWSSEFMNERATIIKKAIPFLFFDSSLAVWNMD